MKSMTLKEANDFLKTLEGLEYLKHITNEYGFWDENRQTYNMLVTKAVSLAIAELTCIGKSIIPNPIIE